VSASAGWGAWLRRAGTPLLAVLPQWLVARAVVLGALALARLVTDRAHVTGPGAVARVHQGLLGWDAGWYKAIATFGYVPLGHQSFRFFPLVPLAARALSQLPGVTPGAALLVVANGCSLVATALFYVLVRRESGDVDLSRRAVWLLCLVPPAFVFVMGYAEATLLLFCVACFLAIRPTPVTRVLARHHRAPGGLGPPIGPGAASVADPATRPSPLGAPPAGGPAPVPVAGWVAAAVFGVAAALTRPLGVVLVVAVAIEAVRAWPQSTTGQRVAAVVATVAPVGGLLAFLGWSRAATGDFFLPLRVQSQAGHHGGLSNPLSTLSHDASGALHHHLGTALHVPWVILVVALLVVCWRRWPASYGAFATAVVVLALAGSNLDSFERYALSAFPLVMTGATLISGVRVSRVVLTLSAAGLGAYALMAFFNILVP